MMAVDVGGTFTDVIGIRDGAIEATKVPNLQLDVEQAVLTGAEALGLEGRAAFNHASTVGLNAIITRRLPRIGFLTTYGHRDMLDAARSWRPMEALSDASYRRPFSDASGAPMVPRFLRRGVRERIKADGTVLIPLDLEQARYELERFRRCEVDGVAICLLNAYANPEHEERLQELVVEVLGDLPCSISSAVSPLAKEYARASTTVVDLFMKIVYHTYSADLERGLRDRGFDGALNFADCAAMLLEREHAMEHPFKVVFSGPAAGAMASARFGDLIGDQHLLCCDVGGTSSDISVVTGGEPFLNTTIELEPDLLVNALSVDLGTLGAGGGSLIRVASSGELRVGPESAGGNPGPACYGRGGTEPTMTDACLLIGLLDPDAFNAGKMRLDPEAARGAFEGLDTPLDFGQRVSHAYRIGVNNIAEGLIDVAVRQGIDPRDYSIVAYGAAGPLLLSPALDIVRARRVVVPPYPGLFSALGLLSSDLVFAENRSAYLMLTQEAAPEIDSVFAEMESRLREQIPAGSEVVIRRTFDGRLFGQSWETPFVELPEGTIDGPAVERMIANFHDVYEGRFGNRFEAIPVEGVTYRVQAVIPSPKVEYPALAESTAPPEPVGEVDLRYLTDGDDVTRALVFERERLRAGDTIEGPAIVREPMSTTQLLAGQTLEVGRFGELLITATKEEG
jgi:N-methylhydantoinase A